MNIWGSFCKDFWNSYMCYMSVWLILRRTSYFEFCLLRNRLQLLLLICSSYPLAEGHVWSRLAKILFRRSSFAQRWTISSTVPRRLALQNDWGQSFYTGVKEKFKMGAIIRLLRFATARSYSSNGRASTSRYSSMRHGGLKSLPSWTRSVFAIALGLNA